MNGAHLLLIGAGSHAIAWLLLEPVLAASLARYLRILLWTGRVRSLETVALLILLVCDQPGWMHLYCGMGMLVLESWLGYEVIQHLPEPGDQEVRKGHLEVQTLIHVVHFLGISIGFPVLRQY